MSLLQLIRNKFINILGSSPDLPRTYQLWGCLLLVGDECDMFSKLTNVDHRPLDTPVENVTHLYIEHNRRKILVTPMSLCAYRNQWACLERLINHHVPLEKLIMQEMDQRDEVLWNHATKTIQPPRADSGVHGCLPNIVKNMLRFLTRLPNGGVGPVFELSFIRELIRAFQVNADNPVDLYLSCRSPDMQVPPLNMLFLDKPGVHEELIRKWRMTRHTKSHFVRLLADTLRKNKQLPSDSPWFLTYRDEIYGHLLEVFEEMTIRDIDHAEVPNLRLSTTDVIPEIRPIWERCSYEERIDLYHLFCGHPQLMVSVTSVMERALLHIIAPGTLCDRLFEFLIKKNDFWVRLRPCQEEGRRLHPMISACQMVSNVHHTESRNLLPVLVGSVRIGPNMFECMVRIARRCGRLVNIHPCYVDTVSTIQLLQNPRVPPSIRRVLWYCLLTSDDLSDLTILREFENAMPPIQIPPDLPELEVRDAFPQLDPMDLDGDPAVKIRVNRQGHVTNMYELFFGEIVWDEVNPYTCEIYVDGEVARGQSVVEECLKLVWDRCIREKWIIEYACGGMGLADRSMTAGRMLLDESPLFVLGFITSICIQRCILLPYPLANDTWRLLIRSTAEGVPRDTIRCLRDRFMERLRIVKSMTLKEAAMNLGEDPEHTTYEEMVVRNMLPAMEDIGSFVRGFRIVMRGVDLTRLFDTVATRMEPDDPYFNFMFCEPPSHRVSQYAGSVFHIRSNNDRLMVEYFVRLPPDHQTRLLKFITGKPRCPMPTLGEELISIDWDGRQSSILPIAQNCTNRLIFSQRMPTNEESIRRCLQPVLDFPTHFGYL